MRKSTLMALALAPLVLACGASAATPDIIAYTKKIDEVSAFLAGERLCEAVGYTYAPNALEGTIAPVIAQAVKDGLPEDMASGMMKASLESATGTELTLYRDFWARAATASEAGDEKALVANADELYKLLDVRCRGFATTPAFASLITAPVSGGYTHFLEWLIEIYEG